MKKGRSTGKNEKKKKKQKENKRKEKNPPGFGRPCMQLRFKKKKKVCECGVERVHE